MMKKRLVMMLGITMMVSMAVACGSSTEVTTENEEDRFQVGVLQFAEHGSLDNCTEGFIQGLANEGIVEGLNLELEINNASADMGLTAQMASSLATENMDLICGVATPAAQSAYNAAMDLNIPVIFTAVTDPIMAEMADENGMPVGEITGTSDQLAVEAQLAMIREIMPEAKTIGILYTISEVNSISAIAEYEAVVDSYGFELITQGITATADIAVAAQELVGKVDCLTNLTDNTVVNSLPTVIGLANEAGIPVFGSEVEQVAGGCLAAEGIDYLALGVQTGEMAAKVLRGEAKASELEFETIQSSQLSINTQVAQELGIELPESIIDRAVDSFNSVQ